MNRRNFLKTSGIAGSVPFLAAQAGAQTGAPSRIDLRRATIVIRPGELPNAERTAATVLVEEIASRCGIRLPVSTAWPAAGPVIAITSERQVPAWNRAVPGGESRPEGFRLSVEHVRLCAGGLDCRRGRARRAFRRRPPVARAELDAAAISGSTRPSTSPPRPPIPSAATSSAIARRPTPTTPGTPRSSSSTSAS